MLLLWNFVHCSALGLLHAKGMRRKQKSKRISTLCGKMACKSVGAVLQSNIVKIS